MAKEKTTKPVTKQNEIVTDNTVLKLIIPAKQAQAGYDQALKQSAKNVKLKGFRQGKVPAKMAEEQLGQPELVERAINQILPQAYADLIKKEQKQPISDPSFRLISADKGKDWEVEVQIAEAPTVTLTGYQKAASAAKKTAEKEIADHQKADEKAKKAGTHDGHDHNHDDDSVKLHHIFRALIATIKPGIPELLVKQETQRQLQQLVSQLDQLKVTLDDYLARRKQTFEQLTSEMAVQSLANLQLEFILLELVKELKIKIDDQAVKTELELNFPDNQKQQANPYLAAQVQRNLERKAVIAHLLKL